jgi:DNA-binding protein HU-beta
MKHKDFIRYLAQRQGLDEKSAATQLEAVTSALFDCFQRGESVTITNFGSFYVNVRRHGTVFKFNPAQKLRALFGWSSTYKGDF